MKHILGALLILTSFTVLAQQVDVTIPNGNYPLNGTISTPGGSGPHPAIILIHGSGPNDRNSTVVLTGGNSQCLYPNLIGDTIRPFKDLAEVFSDSGYAVIRYDKRSMTYGSQLDPKIISPYDFIEDVHSVIDFAKSRAEIDASRIILFGHSQGANFLPIIAHQRDDISALVAYGTAARGIDTILAMQIRELYYYCLNDTASGNSIYNSTLSDFESIRNGSWNNNQAYLGTYSLFWRDWMDITDSSVYNFKSIDQPSLFIHGMNEFNIPLEDAERYENRVTRDSVDVFYLEGVNHFMTSPFLPKVVKVVPDTIVKWLSHNKTVSFTKQFLNQEQDQFSVRYAGHEVFVIFSGNKLPDLLKVYDMSGRVVRTIAVNDNKLQLGTSNLSKGFYILSTNINGIQVSRKIEVGE